MWKAHADREKLHAVVLDKLLLYIYTHVYIYTHTHTQPLYVYV